MKRIICAVLALLMLMCTLVACVTPNDSSEVTTDTQTIGNDTATIAPYDTTPNSNLPKDLDFNKQTVTILSRDHAWFIDEISVENGQIGEYINDAVYSRNLAVEEQLNVKIVNILQSGDGFAISNRVGTAIMAGTQEFDAFVNSTFATIQYSGKGYFNNLLDCEYLDLEQPWWSQGYNDLASIGNSQYLMSGAINLSLLLVKSTPEAWLKIHTHVLILSPVTQRLLTPAAV